MMSMVMICYWVPFGPSAHWPELFASFFKGTCPNTSNLSKAQVGARGAGARCGGFSGVAPAVAENPRETSVAPVFS